MTPPPTPSELLAAVERLKKQICTLPAKDVILTQDEGDAIYCALTSAAEQLEQERRHNGELREFLCQFGVHKSWCRNKALSANAANNTCSCGLDAAMKKEDA